MTLAETPTPQPRFTLSPTQHAVAEALWRSTGALVHPWYPSADDPILSDKEQLAAVEDVHPVLRDLKDARVEDGGPTDLETAPRSNQEIEWVAGCAKKEVKRRLANEGLGRIERFFRGRRASRVIGKATINNIVNGHIDYPARTA